jgi:hypothetical protein
MDEPVIARKVSDSDVCRKADFPEAPPCCRSDNCAINPIMVIRAAVLAFAFAVATIGIADAQELPPLPSTLLNASGAVCITISKQGDVGGAYILASTGDAQADKDMLAWVQQLHWPVTAPGEKMRDKWFPMPIGFGGKTPPKVPATCAPPA